MSILLFVLVGVGLIGGLFLWSAFAYRKQHGKFPW